METPTGLDFASGIPIGKIPEGGMIQGKAWITPISVARLGRNLRSLRFPS
jgi:hypothetical protein